ncbi:MAG: hypothetical protein ACI4PQ_06085 [Butyricicoccaceae bacterium]
MIKYGIEKARQYVRSMTLLEVALLKFCLLGLGIVIGTSVAEQRKPVARGCGMAMFLISYIPLMSSFLAGLFSEE